MSDEVRMKIKQSVEVVCSAANRSRTQLETRAGSPLGGGGLIDPLGLDPTQPQP